MNKKTSFRQLISILMCICFIFVSLFLVTYIVKETNHSCPQCKCPVCARMLKAEQILKHLSSSISNSYTAIIVAFSCLFYIMATSLNIQVSTPITLKVKMLN